MTSRNNTLRVACLLGLAGLIAVTGCEKKKPPPPPPPPVIVRPPPPKVEVEALLQELKSDARVQFAEAAAPTDRTLAEGAIRLADAIARGDSAALRKMLDRGGQHILDELVNTAEWADETAKIEAVRIAQMQPLGGGSIVTTAIQEPGGAYVLNWTAAQVGDGIVFSPLTAASGTKPRASDWDTANVLFSVQDTKGLENVSPEEVQKALEEAGVGSEPGSNPMRKNTPGGPITIPNPGGGSPGGG
ncbi:MAG: hypothetical protein IT437_04435 [Phycisphaerales bacterium]|nr:hypothetical protein [Phycisphaerales bacterium]